MLPAEVPNQINCLDSLNQKQGWWIDYKIQYNPTKIPEALDSGYYVDHYQCGEYLNNEKIGVWRKIQNVHQISWYRIDSFIETPDYKLVITDFPNGIKEEKFELLNNDTLEYYSKVFTRKSNFPFEISCIKKESPQNQCTTKFKGVVLNVFPLENLDYEHNYIKMNLYYFNKRKLFDSLKQIKATYNNSYR